MPRTYVQVSRIHLLEDDIGVKGVAMTQIYSVIYA
jgi:hypothetical protein